MFSREFTTSIKRTPEWYAAAAETFLVLNAVCLAVRLLPFRHAIRLGSRKIFHPRSFIDERVLRRSVGLVNRWSDLLPWRSVCIQRGLALQWLLRSRGIDARLHYGARILQQRGLQAHVWVCVADRIVIGETVDDFKCLAVFPRDRQ